MSIGSCHWTTPGARSTSGGASITRNDPTLQLRVRHLQNSPVNTGPKRILRGSRRSNFLPTAGPVNGGRSEHNGMRGIVIGRGKWREFNAKNAVRPSATRRVPVQSVVVPSVRNLRLLRLVPLNPQLRQGENGEREKLLFVLLALY